MITQIETLFVEDGEKNIEIDDHYGSDAVQFLTADRINGILTQNEYIPGGWQIVFLRSCVGEDCWGKRELE